MKKLLNDEKTIITRQLQIICGFFILILIVIALLFGSRFLELIQGAEPMSNLQETTQIDTNAYIDLDVYLISGSYAEKGVKKGTQTYDKTVYYLMPLDQGNYFMSIIASDEMVEKLDEMENAFFQSIGEESKIYPENVHVRGSFRKLNEEELNFALDYFKEYDETVKERKDLDRVMSMYAFVYDEIQGYRINDLWLLMGIWVLLFLICVSMMILFAAKFFMRPLLRDIAKLDKEVKKSIDFDYTNAAVIDNIKIGTIALYQRRSFTWRLWQNDHLIWIYKKECLSKRRREYEICIFDEYGTKTRLWIGKDEGKADRILKKLSSNCTHALVGFEAYLYEEWKRDPKHLQEKCKSFLQK